MADDELNKRFNDSQKELKRLENEINKKSGATSKKQLKQLKKLKLAYAKQSKIVKSFAKEIKALRVEKTHLTKVAEQLTSKFGGSASAVTKFTDGVKDAIFTVDNATGKMNMFGKELGATAGKFSLYAAGIQLAIAASMAFLDWMDKLEKKQGTLQRAVGMSGVAIGASQRTMAKGWGIAGKTGEKAAEELTAVIAQSRKGLWDELVGEKGEGAGIGKLTTMTAGMSQQVPQWTKMLSETFAETSGADIIDSLTKIGVVAYKANVPMDQFGNMVFDLAKEFVHLGVDVEEATAALSTFADEMGEGAIKPAVGLAAMRTAIQQQTTAAGLQGRFMTAAFADKNFGDLGDNAQTVLNARAREMTENENVTYQGLSIGQQATTLKSLGEGQYAQVMRGVYEMLKEKPEIVATAIAPQVSGGMEWATMKEFFENLKEGGDTTQIGEDLASKMASPTDKFKSAAEEFGKYIKENARLQQEFYSGLMEQLGLAKADIGEIYTNYVKEGDDIIVAAGKTAMEWERQSRQKEAEEARRKLKTLEDKSSPEAALLEAQIARGEGKDVLSKLVSMFVPETPSKGNIVAPEGTTMVPGGNLGEQGVIDTPEGTFTIIYTGPANKGVEGAPSKDTSNTDTR